MVSKRILSFVLAIILLIGCFVLNYVNNGIVTVGPGNGVDEKVDDPVKLAEVLNYLGEYKLSRGVASNNSGGVVYLSDTENEDEIEAEVSKTKYTGATIIITTSLSASSSTDNPQYISNKLAESEQQVNRELTMYFTEDATYYSSNGYSTLHMKYDGGDDKFIYIRFDMEAYTTATSEYVKFYDLFLTTSSETVQLKATTKGRWIKVPQDTVGDLIDVDGENREVLSSFGEMVELLVKYDMVEAGSSARLDEGDFISAIKQEGDKVPGLFDDASIDFTIDLTNPTCPTISSISVVDSKKTSAITTGYDNFFNPETVTVTIFNKSNIVQNITIKNINNTVINFDESRDIIEAENRTKFDNLFIIEEVESYD